jgi:cyclophilin family peptidyl-prolyl cis-trans isomerase
VAKEKFTAAAETLRSCMKQTQRAGTLYFQTPKDEAEAWQEKWNAATEEGQRAASELKSAARILITAPAPDQQVLQVARLLWAESFGTHQFEQAYQISRELVRREPERSDVQLNHARAALLTNRFAEASHALKAANQPLTDLPKIEQDFFRNLDAMIAKFKREQEFRAVETESDDLPRVELTTSKGEIVIELFENEAPETVANFICHVENKFYDDTLFHHVVKNRMEMAVAQGGMFTMQSRKVVPYLIRDEYANKNARQNFRGVIGMANQGGKPNTASSQFYFTLLPLLHLDEHHTVFGRVISGIENLDKIEATMSISDKGEESAIDDVIPDQIISARVLRKREHPYEPTPVKSN